MGVNPFGDESDSVHAWKERFKQQQFQTQTLQQQLGQIKKQLEDLQIKYEEVSKQLNHREDELQSARKELKEMKDIAKTSRQELQNIEHKTEINRIQNLEKQNQELKLKIENLQSQLIRGSGSLETTISDDSGLSQALVPLMLYNYDPNNPAYKNAYEKLVESIVNYGSPRAKIIGLLIKFNGKGPLHKLKEIVNSERFEDELSSLIEKGVVTRLDDNIQIVTHEIEGFSPKNMESLSTIELFDYLIQTAEKQPDENLIDTLEMFRDTIQERNIPLTTIFFELRKISERLERKDLSRSDVIDQIKSWKERYIAMS